MNFVKHLPWIAPTVAILAVGTGFLDRINVSLDADEAPVAQAEPAAPAVLADPDAAAALAAVEAPVVDVAPANAADQLASLLTAPEAAPAEDVEVTRNQGFSINALEQASDLALSAQPEQTAPMAAPEPVAQATSGAVGADFFSAAQANLAQANSCANDLRNLSSQAKVYFPSGALTGESSGIAQARLIGTIAQRCPGVMIEVQGHSDPSGNPAINLRLSQERAEAVIARVAAAGIDTTMMVAVGMGDGFPSNVSGPEGAAYYDRRVEFTVVDTVQDASFTQPTFGGAASFQNAACVGQLQTQAEATHIDYAPGSVVVSQDDLDAALTLARLAAACPQARLRVVGQHSKDFGTIEDPSTGRLRAIALITSLVGNGYDSSKIIMAAPSETDAIQGLSNSRIDFEVVLEEL